MTVYREGGAAARIDKRRDTVFTTDADGATAWMPTQDGEGVSVFVHKAFLKAKPNNQPGFDILSMRRDFPNATVVLEHKFGGQVDETAVALEEFVNSVVALNSYAVPRGFIRLRAVCVDTSQDPSGVVMTMHRNSAS